MNVVSGALLLGLLLAAAAVTLVARGRARATTLDFYLAGRRVGMVTNACAICGDYFSAASFLGVAAAVYASGLDGAWYATGFAAGFVPVLLFVAAPLRRFGHVSIPDFLGARFSSDRVRKAAVIAVELVILSYLVPQAVASGIVWEVLIGAGVLGLTPYATGVLASALLVSGLVVVGGMRGTTWNQALQFLFLLAVMFWLVAVAVGQGQSYPEAVAEASATPLSNPSGGALEPVPNRLADGRTTQFGMPGSRYGNAGQLALMVTLVLGTAGLPHVMIRYFTSPSGRVARLTTVWVLGLAGGFYVLAVLLGTVARVVVAERAATTPWLQELTVDGVLVVPEHALLVLGRLFGGVSGLGLVASAAFAAMISTIGGLLLAAAASWGHDIYERYLRPEASQREAVNAGRIAVVAASAASSVIALSIVPTRLVDVFPSVIATMVTWSFALAGSAITPALLLAIWWRRTTAGGIVAGIVVGTVAVVTMLVVGVARGGSPEGFGAVLLAPTVVAAPLSALAVTVQSLRQPPPDDVVRVWTRMHGTASDRQVERFVRLSMRES